MTGLLESPRLLKKNIDKKREQLWKILEDLRHRPPDDPERPRVLERMFHLQNSFPELETLYAEISGTALAEVLDGGPSHGSAVTNKGSAHGEQLREIVEDLKRRPLDDQARAELLERLLRLQYGFPEPDVVSGWDKLSKSVREGRTVSLLYDQLRKMRSLYREKGFTATQIRKQTEYELNTAWEWIDRIGDQEQKAEFLRIDHWEDGAEFIFLQIAMLYRYVPHLRRKPSWRTLRDWRKAYLGHLKHHTGNGRRRAQ